jgi:hypothetical protein
VIEFLKNKRPNVTVTDWAGLGSVVFQLDGNGPGSMVGKVYKLVPGAKRYLATYHSGSSGSKVDWMVNDLTGPFVKAVNKANE